MQEIKIQCPAKVNLSLKITGKRPDGYHEIESIMQTINLYDYLTIKVSDCQNTEIILSGNNTQIPYDNTNLVHKAANLYLNTLGIKNKKIDIYIDKNIPVAAGLAGGSTDAAGTLYGLNVIFKSLNYKNTLNNHQLHELCAKLGSDLNVCLQGGRLMTKGRGEIIEPLPFQKSKISLIKPLNLGISAKEAYTKFSIKKSETEDKRNEYVNDLEWAIIDDYKELQYIKNNYPKSIMTGSGSTYYLIDGVFTPQTDFWIQNNLEFVDNGVLKI